MMKSKTGTRCTSTPCYEQSLKPVLETREEEGATAPQPTLLVCTVLRRRVCLLGTALSPGLAEKQVNQQLSALQLQLLPHFGGHSYEAGADDGRTQHCQLSCHYGHSSTQPGH